jgi:hypothetical protein
MTNLEKIVRHYYTDKYHQGKLKAGQYFDVIADITLDPDSIILYANEMLTDQEATVDDGECPVCGGTIECITDSNGLKEHRFEELVNIICLECDWSLE